jgi:MinD superfamily P-loop ATPase
VEIKVSRLIQGNPTEAQPMKELVIVSGKGGTGKTSLTAAFAALATNHVVSDCDVDAPNLHLLLAPQVEKTEDFIASKTASINPELCTECYACKESCRFDAISEELIVDSILCEGCGVCKLVCLFGAVKLEDCLSGHIYASETEYCPMAHALLLPGEANSGKLVTRVRQLAKELAKEKGKELVLIDGPPGIACATIATISGATAGVVVAEPTVPAIHDMERALQLFAHFKIPAMVVINKYDLNLQNAKAIESYCADHDVEVVGRIPFDDVMIQAVVAGKPVVTYAPQHNLTKALRDTWAKIEKRFAHHDS